MLHNELTIKIEPNKYPLKGCIMKEQFILTPISIHWNMAKMKPFILN